MTYEQMQLQLQKELKPSRFAHTMGVVETAVSLAAIHGCDTEQAKLAALLHDCGKYLTNEERLFLCHQNNREIRPVEKRNPSLLHAPCGAFLAREKYGVEDAEILHAIEVHTTGMPDMSLLDKIIYVSDYIEPMRNEAPRLDELRKLAKEDLNETVRCISEDTIRHLSDRHPDDMDPRTLQTLKFYQDLTKTTYLSGNASLELAKIAYHALDEKKAMEIKVIDIRDISVLADYFVIATGGNPNQLQAMTDAVVEELAKHGHKMKLVEGSQSSGWILMDYKDIVVHIFAPEERRFYNLERTWQDGSFLHPEDF